MAAIEQPLPARFCKAHFDRAGVSVPAVHFIGDDGFCARCFRGKAVADRVFSSSAIDSWCGPALSARSIERIRHRTLRIRRRRANVCDPRAIPFRRPEPKRRQPEPQKGDPLTPRELQIVELLAKGLRTAAVAAAAGMSIRTAKFHISHALKKSGAADRSGLLLWWIQERGAAASDSLALARVERIEAELGVARAGLAQIERAFAELKASIAARGENCQLASMS